MLAQPLNGAADVLSMFHQRLDKGFTAEKAAACHQALENRQPHLLKPFGLDASSIYERGDVRVYRLRRHTKDEGETYTNEVFVRVDPWQKGYTLHWHHTAAELCH